MKKTRNHPLLLLLFGFIACSNSDDNSETAVEVNYSPAEIFVEYTETTLPFYIRCEEDWMVYSDESWIACAKNTTDSSMDSNGTATVTIAANDLYTERDGTIVIKSGTTRVYIPVKQTGKLEAYVDPTISVPDGYRLVWQDEFTDNTLVMPNESLWWYEVWGPGYVNNELQRYVKGKQGDAIVAEVSEGTLKIHARKVGDEVISARINTIESWKYGYFEARLKLPIGKGTWPAFWMMPKQTGIWPDCGEIDIMEEVGYNPDYVSSSIHTKSYYHTIGTQKTKEMFVSTAQTEFHVYALEWTEDYIRTYIDGKEFFYFANDKSGSNDTWPFNAAFYLKLNLAWGGDWGGAQGVDESVLPATYEIDYVRVFQKVIK